MFEQDYILRLINEMIRALLKLLFNIDIKSSVEEVLESREEKELLKELEDMIDRGKINEAENRLYDLTENRDMQNLKIALLFYSYLNSKPDDFLNEHCFGREEIKTGIQNLVAAYDLSSIADIFTDTDG